jgi:hypothetical protein
VAREAKERAKDEAKVEAKEKTRARTKVPDAEIAKAADEGAET